MKLPNNPQTLFNIFLILITPIYSLETHINPTTDIHCSSTQDCYIECNTAWACTSLSFYFDSSSLSNTSISPSPKFTLNCTDPSGTNSQQNTCSQARVFAKIKNDLLININARFGFFFGKLNIEILEGTTSPRVDIICHGFSYACRKGNYSIIGSGKGDIMMDCKGGKSCSQMDLNFMGVDSVEVSFFFNNCFLGAWRVLFRVRVFCDFVLEMESVLPVRWKRTCLTVFAWFGEVLEGRTRNCVLWMWTVHFCLRGRTAANLTSNPAGLR